MSNKEIFLDEVNKLFEGTIGMESAKAVLQDYLCYRTLDRERVAFDLSGVTDTLHNFAVMGDRGSGKSHLADIICNMLRYDKENCQTIYMRNIKERKDMDELFKSQGTAIIIDNIDDFFLNDGVSENAQKDMVNCFEDLMNNNMEEDGCTIIITGSQDAMDRIRHLNSALENYFFGFVPIDKYSEKELWKILESLALKTGFHIFVPKRKTEDEERRYADIKRWLTTESKLKGFTNTIALENILNEAKKNMAFRYKKFEQEQGRNILSINEDEMQSKLCNLTLEDLTKNGNEKTVDELCKELEGMIGLKRAKEEVRKQIARVNISMRAAKAGANRRDGFGTLHMAFVGEPGTGKTTVADIVGKIYCALGVLPRKDVLQVSRADLISQYVGGTAHKVSEICKSADGGVLFIDEAYSLVNSDQDSYGLEAVNTLIQEMENRRGTMMVILAGYEEPMNKFLDANPGFKSRVPNFIHFDNYTPREMGGIFEYMAKAKGIYPDPDVYAMLEELFVEKSKEADFGNARGVRNVLDAVIAAHDVRIEAKSNAETYEYNVLTKEDILAIQNKAIKKEKTIEQLLDELDNLEGLYGVKQQVNDMIDSMQYIRYMKEQGEDPGRNQGTMHLIFSGNPGTGKSTVASLLGQIYVKLGVLKKNTFVLAKRSDLVAQYTGQTAPKVANKVAEADGGILFIDEAYQLYNGEHDSFGVEAIGTLLSLVEEKRDSLMVILAGYTENMDEFLSVNPGLRSRFPNTIEFTDYSVPELLSIFKKMAEADNKILEDGVIELVKEKIDREQAGNEREFANARGVRNILDEIIVRQRSRIMSEIRKGKKHEKEELKMIKKEDIRI